MHDDLIKRLEALSDPDRELDVEIEVALHKPSADWPRCRANDAKTKVIYTDSHGTDHTHWARDHTLTSKTKARAIAALRARMADNG